MEDTFRTMLGKYVSKGKVFIFSKSYCPYCVDAKNLFKSIGVKYEAVEVDQSNGFAEDFIQYINKHANIKTYPKVYIGEKCIGGFSDLNNLFNNMKLFDMLKAENISYDE